MSDNKNSAGFATVVLFTVYGFTSQYLIPCILAGILLTFIVTSLWKPYVPPILVYVLSFQFLQTFAAIVYADFFNTAEEGLFIGFDAEFLLIATFLQLAAMAFMVSKTFKVKRNYIKQDLEDAAMLLDVRKVMIGYAVSALAFPTLISAFHTFSSVSQLIQSFAVIKKIFMMMLLFIVFLRKTKYKNLIIGIFVMEFVLSFVSYFSSFKEVFLYIIIVYLTLNPAVKRKTVMRLAPVVAGLTLILIFWSSIKIGYREFLNNGSRQQEITVDKLAALDYVTDRASSYTLDSMAVGGEVLVHRLQYMQQYSKVYSRVPSIIPHANGKNLSGSLSFLFAPRSFVDKKAILDPSTKATYYTGRSFANAEQGTSISMGYFADLYIDYGIWGMFIPLLIIAYATGKAASYIVNYNKYNLIFNYALFIGVFLSLGTFESDIIFYLGSIRNYIVVMIVGNAFVFPWINKYVKA